MIAIDPGKLGGIAYNDTDGTLKCVKMPIGMTEIYHHLKDMRDLNPDNMKAVIESVGYTPGDGGKGAFSFGEHVGHLHMALYALQISLVGAHSPQSWQKCLMLPKEPVAGLTGKEKDSRTRRRKNLIKEKMAKRYPHLKVTLYVADALAIYTHEVIKDDFAPVCAGRDGR